MRRWGFSFGLKQKLMLAFAVFVVLVSVILLVVSLGLFSQRLQDKNLLYVSDITYQTVNSVKMYAKEMEDVTFAILSSNLMQEKLRQLNAGGLTDAETVRIAKTIDEFLSIYTLYNDDIISLSLIADSGNQFVSQWLQLNPTKSLFTREELYEANGSALWGLINDDEKALCVERAVLDLKTQKPIGYISLVFRQSYIGGIMDDISISYENGSYLLSDDGLILSSNVPARVGQTLDVLNGQGEGWNTYESSVGGVPSYVYKGQRINNGWTLVTVIPRNELAKESLSLLSLILLVDGVVILLAIVTVWALVKRITSPIDRLCRNMQEVGQGNFEKREAIATNDEIGMLSRSYNEMVDNIEALIEQVYLLEITNQQAELEFLKMQINPHFLYNTLDTISWMARMEKKDDIADVTIALAALLRGNIKQDSHIPIHTEMENIRNYLLIQKYRFGEKLDWKLVIEPQCENYYMPGFILQPLVENAIIHGLEPKQSSGRLLLSIKEEDEVVKFIVADNGVGIRAELLHTLQRDLSDKTGHASIGLKNADRRLRLHYGEEAALHIESSVNIGTRIFFCIPLARCTGREKHTHRMRELS